MFLKHSWALPCLAFEQLIFRIWKQTSDLTKENARTKDDREWIDGMKREKKTRATWND